MAEREAVGGVAPPAATGARQEAAVFDDQLLAELLVSSKLLTQEQLDEAQGRLAAADAGGAMPLPRALVADHVGVLVQAVDSEAGLAEGQIPLGEAIGDPGQWPSWSGGQIVVVNPDEPEILESFAPPAGAALGLFATPAGSFLYPGAPPTRERSPSVLGLPSPLVAPTAVTNRPLDLVASPTGEFVVAANRGAGTVHVLVTNTNSQLGALTIRAPGTKRSLGVAIHDRLAYITDGLTPRLTIVELTTLRVRHQAFPTGPLGPVGITPDGQTLFLVFYKGTDDLGLLTVTTADLRVRHLLNLPGRKIAPAPLEPFRVMPSGQLAYLAVQEGELANRFRLLGIDLTRKKVAKELALESLPLTIALPPPRRWLPNRPTLAEIVVDLGLATADELDRLQDAEPGGPPLMDPRIDPQVLGQVPERMMRTMGIVPMYREGGELLVAMVNPRDPTALQLASQLAGGLQLKVIPIEESELDGFMADRYPGLMERFHAIKAGLAAPTPPAAPAPAAPEPPAPRAPAPPAPQAAPAPMPIPPSVRPAAAPRPQAEPPHPQVKDYPRSIDSWIGPQAGRALLVDAMRRQVVEIFREKREGWALRNTVAGGATYLPGGTVLVVDSAQGKVLEIDPKTSQPVWSFGGGDRNKQLRGPRGATRLSNGNTLIADTGNHRVMVVTPQGEIVWSYGEYGKAGCAHGSLFKPQGAFRGKNGNTLIADSGNHRVVEVNEAGEVVWQYGNHVNRLGGGQGSGANQLSDPSMALRLDEGPVLIADTGNQRVLEIDEMKQITWHYRPGATRGGTAIRDPLCVARVAEGRTFIAGRSGVIEVDADQRIVWEFHFTTKSEATQVAGAPPVPGAVRETPGPEDRTPLNRAQDIPVNLPGTFLLVDRMRSRILEIDRNMQVAWQFSGLGGGERNRIDHPHWASRLANANTLITDTNHHRVVEVRDNAIVWQFGKRGEEGTTPRHLSQPRSAERSPTGTTVIADFGNHRVLEVNAAQECVWRKDGLSGPAYAAKIASGNILVVDWSAHLVLEINDRGMPVWQYGQMGNNGKGANQLFHPEHASRLENGNTLICDTQNHRVIEVNPDKQIVWQYGGEPEFLGRKGRFAMQMLTPVVAWRLPSGRTMVHHAGANHVVELESDLSIVWHFTLTF